MKEEMKKTLTDDELKEVSGGSIVPNSKPQNEIVPASRPRDEAAPDTDDFVMTRDTRHEVRKRVRDGGRFIEPV